MTRRVAPDPREDFFLSTLAIAVELNALRDDPAALAKLILALARSRFEVAQLLLKRSMESHNSHIAPRDWPLFRLLDVLVKIAAENRGENGRGPVL